MRKRREDRGKITSNVELAPSIPFDELRLLNGIRALTPDSARLRNSAYAVMNQTLRGARYQVHGVALRALSSTANDSTVTPVTIYSSKLDVGNLIEIAVDAKKLADALKTSVSDAEAWLKHLQTEVAHYAAPKTSLQYPRIGIRSEEEHTAVLSAWKHFVAERRWPITASRGASVEIEGCEGPEETYVDGSLAPVVVSDERGEERGRWNVLEVTRVEKAAADAGFDRTVEYDGEWLVFRSTAFPVAVGVTDRASAGFFLAVSDILVGHRLESEFALAVLPGADPWAIVFDVVDGFELLYAMFQRAARIALVLERDGLREFRAETAISPRTTEAERLVVQRVGQGIFRRTLIDYWGSRCVVTGLELVDLLRASHIKPWADCENDTERLDVFNGLLLAPHLDALFDKGCVTFSDDGELLLSPQLKAHHLAQLGLDLTSLRRCQLADGHRLYLAWHRARVFRAGGA